MLHPTSVLRAASPATIPETETFRFTVNEKSIAALIAAGGYDRQNAALMTHCYSRFESCIGEFEARFTRAIHRNSKPRIKTISVADDGWVAANIDHALSFGIAFPDEQRTHPIIALGTTAAYLGQQYAPILNGGETWRGLGLTWVYNQWPHFCRFLEVRRVRVF